MTDLAKSRESMKSKDDKPSKMAEYMAKHGRLIVEQNLAKEDIRRAINNNAPIDLRLPCDITNALLDALRFTEFYRSDLLIDIDCIKEEIFNGRKSGIRLIGFRKNGVDGTAYVECQFEGWYLAGRHDMMNEYYRKLYCLVWNTIEDDSYYNGNIQFKLLDVTETHPYSDPFDPKNEDKIL